MSGACADNPGQVRIKAPLRTESVPPNYIGPGAPIVDSAPMWARGYSRLPSYPAIRRSISPCSCARNCGYEFCW